MALRLAQAWAAEGAPDAPRFDLIFIDPPYHREWLEKVLPLCARLLAERGIVYVESEAALDGEAAPAWMDDWEIVRADRAGLVFYHLLQRKSGQQ